MRCNFILFLVFFFKLTGIIYFPGKAQTSLPSIDRTFTIGANGLTGFVYMHSSKIGHLITEHPAGIELFINKNSYGKKAWQQEFNFPDVGFSLTYFDFKNDKIGKIISTIVYYDFILSKRESKSESIFKIGTGLGFNNNPYDPETNNKNNIISFPVTYALQARFGYNYKLNNRSKITSSISLSHFSNGAFKLPNSGVNVVSANLGFSYKLSSREPYFDRTTDQQFPASVPMKKFRYNIGLFSGAREVAPVGGKKYSFLNLNTYGGLRVSRKSSLLLGADFFYSWAIKEEINRSRELKPGENPDFKRIGLTAGYEMHVNRVALIAQFGVYIYRPFKYSGQPVYQRYGLKYNFSKTFYTGFFLKAHYGVAENVEFGVGIKI